MLTSPKNRGQHTARSALASRRLRLRPFLPGIQLSSVSSTVGARVVASLLSFVAGVITARGLGSHGRALLALAIAVPAIFGVVGVLGLDNANARFAGRSHSAYRQIVRRSVVFAAVGGSAMAAAWGFAALFWPALRLGLDPKLILFSAMLCPVSLLLTLLATAEIGRGRIAVYNMVTTATAAVYLADVLLLLATDHLTVVMCFMACAASQSLGVAALLVLATARVHPDGELVTLGRYSSYAFRAYLPNLAQYGMLRMDVPIIQVLAGTTAVALYAVALPVAEGIMLLPTAVALVIFPKVTSGHLGRHAADRVGRVVLAATVVLAGVAALASPVVIPAVYGVPYRGAVTVIWCMLPGLVFFTAGRTRQAYLAATDKLGPVIGATFAGVAAGLAALLMLTPRFGAAGAGIADSLGYLAFTVVVLGGLHRKGPVLRLVARSATSGRRLGRRAWPTISPAWRDVRRTVLCCAAVATGLAAALLSARDATQLSTVLAVVTALVVIAVPGAGLLVIAVACPISQTSFGATLVTEKDLIVLLIASLLSHIAAGRSFRPKAWTVALSASAVCYFLVSGTLAGGGGSSGQNWRYVMMLGVPLLVLPVIAGNDVLTRRAVIAFGFSTACLAVAEALKSHASLTAAGSASAAGSALAAANNTGAVNHNAEGAIFVLALAGLLARFPHARRAAEKLALAAAITALVIGIAYSFSRSAYFGALAVITLFAARRSIRGLACAAVAVGCLVLVLPTAVGARLGSVWGSSGLDVSSALRLDLWSSALRMFEAHPVFGVGYLNFAAQLPGYYINSGSYDTFVIQFSLLDFAHNTYLTVLAETGLVGVVLVGALIAIGSHRAWVAARHGSWTGEGALLGLVGVGICSAFGEVLLVSPILASFLLTVLAADRTRGGSRDAIPPVAASAERT